MSVYSYMANNKKKWRAVYRYTDFTGKKKTDTEKEASTQKEKRSFGLKIRRKPKTDN